MTSFALARVQNRLGMTMANRLGILHNLGTPIAHTCQGPFLEEANQSCTARSLHLREIRPLFPDNDKALSLYGPNIPAAVRSSG
jgi:hypothetical protein